MRSMLSLHGVDCQQRARKSEKFAQSIGPTIYQIRFSSMTSEKFAVLHKSMEGFFTADELVELLYITTKLNDFTPKMFNQMPRNQPKYRLNMFTGPPIWSFECNRFEHDLLTLKRQPMNISEIRFRFDCDHPIRLHGIVLGIHLKDFVRRVLQKRSAFRLNMMMMHLLHLNQNANFIKAQPGKMKP